MCNNLVGNNFGFNFLFPFFFFKNTKYFNTHTREIREGFKKTNSGVYPKGPDIQINFGG